jgi:hypothetical protein
MPLGRFLLFLHLRLLEGIYQGTSRAAPCSLMFSDRFVTLWLVHLHPARGWADEEKERSEPARPTRPIKSLPTTIQVLCLFPSIFSLFFLVLFHVLHLLHACFGNF